jgi:hypothetical protein
VKSRGDEGLLFPLFVDNDRFAGIETTGLESSEGAGELAATGDDNPLICLD